MKLIMQKVHMNRCNSRETKQITLDRDFNVPDARPDALQIMKEQGEVQIDDVHMIEGKASIKGILKFQILYAVDGNLPVSEMRGEIPFDEQLSLPGAQPGDEITVHTGLSELRSELINSRKLGIKAVVSLEVSADCICDGEGAVDIEEADYVYTKKKTCEISRLVFSKKDILRVRDEWKLPGTKDAIGRVLYWDVQMGEMDSRLSEEELQVEGQAQIFVIYLSDGDEPVLNYFDVMLPIRGNIDCHGCDSTMAARVINGIHSRDIEIKEDEDGESRVLDIELVIDFDIKVYGQDELALLTDFYSPREIYKPVYKPSFFENLIVHNKSRCRVSGKVQTLDYAPLQIWNVSGELRIDRKEQRENGLLATGVVDVSVLYLTGDARVPLATAKGSIPFEQLIEAEGMDDESSVWLYGTLEQIGGTMTGEKEIEIKAVAALDLTAFERIGDPVITDYEREDVDWKARSREPGMVGYVVQQGETIWDIAKNFLTTVDSIMEINQKEGETLQDGEMLLILKETY